MKKIIIYGLMHLLLFAGLSEANAQQKNGEITFEAFVEKLSRTVDPQILDVRTEEEFNQNHLIGARPLSLRDSIGFESGISKLDKHKPVFVYSINNGRSKVATDRLLSAGFREVYSLPGGIAHWIGAGRPYYSKSNEGLSDAEFQHLLSSSNVVLVSVGSRYCGSCRKLAPIVETIKNEQRELIKVVNIELYENKKISQALEIEAVPTVILFKGNKAIWRKSGAITKVDIQDALDNSL